MKTILRLSVLFLYKMTFKNDLLLGNFGSGTMDVSDWCRRYGLSNSTLDTMGTGGQGGGYVIPQPGSDR